MANLSPQGHGPRFVDLTGRVFGALTVLEEASHEGLAVYWRCVCACGGASTTRTSSLLSGVSVRCAACAHSARRTAHAFRGTQIYTAWANMIQRCGNPSCPSWKNYGGRGIEYCERWDMFENFREDMGLPPFPKATLERKDNEGDYEPGNVVWARRSAQARNTRRNLQITLNGRTLCLKDWTLELGLDYDVIKSRILRGWEPERALTAPPERTDPVGNTRVMLQGRTQKLNAWAKELGVSAKAVKTRVARGQSPRDALITPVRPPKQSFQATLDGRTQNLKAWAVELGVSYSTVYARVKLGMEPEEALTTPVCKAKSPK